tara:strand:- start:21539 stop:22126 length:588 start_codon:yes stop_codon:yes gene_type:complete
MIFMAFLVSCGSETPPMTDLSPRQRESCLSVGKKVSDALMMNLGTQLKSTLASGGETAAVQVCQQIAIPITESTSEMEEGVTVRRTSLKVRNPQNAPEEGDVVILKRWERLDQEGKPLPEHELRRLNESQVAYYRPILVQALCLKCHGASQSLNPELRQVLDELYPADQARGYREGDLRGAFRVDIDLNQFQEER